MIDNKTPNWQPTKAEYWHYLPAPARPWPSEVVWFEKYTLVKKAEGKTDVLILGSTVEFRSMLHKNGMNVFIVDFSKNFYNTLTETQKDRLKYTGKETFYEQNWLTMNLGRKFDLIFGDWVPGVLHTKDYDAFFKKIIEHLKDDGLFIGRECLRPDRNQVNMEKVVLKHNKEFSKKYSFYESSMQYVYAYRPDLKTSAWNIKEAKRALKQIFDKSLLDKANYEFMHRALSIEQDGSASVMVKEDFEKYASKYLDIIIEHHVNEPSSAWYPIYVMKLKNRK